MFHYVPTRTDGTSFWQQRTSLEGTDYLLDFAWNTREASWYLSVFDADETPLVLGIRLVCNRPLFRTFRSKPGFPRGELICLDASGKIEVPGFDDLDSVRLVYYDSTDLQ